jgi:cytochrome c553
MLRKILKWIGVVLGSLIGLIVVAGVALYLIGSVRFNKKYDYPVEAMAIPTDEASIQRGEHVAEIHFCQRCHMDDFSGTVFYTIPNLLTIPTPNLTSGAGGVGSLYTDEDWVRALRHGVGQDGHALWIMPSTMFTHLSDDDLGALIAYIKSRPPVDHQLPARTLDPLGRIMLALNMIPPIAVDRIDHSAAMRVSAPAQGATAEYGAYLVSTQCTECHGPELNGAPFGPPGQEQPTPNLTRGGELAAWSERDFVATMRTGITPGGHRLNEEMPWEYFAKMDDDELEAIWLYLQSLPAREQGGVQS